MMDYQRKARITMAIQLAELAGTNVEMSPDDIIAMLDDIQDAYNQQKAEVERLRTAQSATCTWNKLWDEDEVWETGCGEDAVFYDGTPAENGYRYCHYCGKVIVFQELEGDLEGGE